MSLFDQIVSREITRRRQVETERAKASADPAKVSDKVAKMMRASVPEGSRVRTKKHPTKLQAVEAAISEEDPRSSLGSNIVASYEKALRDPSFSGYRPRNILAAVSEAEAEKIEEPTRRFIQKQRSGTFSTFMAEPYVPLPGQEEWEAEHPVPHHMRAEWSAIYGAAGKAALEAAKFAFGKGPAARMGRRKAVALLAKGGPWGKVAAAGVASIAGVRIFEEASTRTTEQVKETEFGKEHPLAAELIGMGVGLAAGLVVPVEAMFGNMLTSQGAKTITKFQTLIKRKNIAKAKLEDNPAAAEILKFKKAEEAAAKASDQAVAVIDKEKPAVIKNLVSKTEDATIPLPGAVARRGIFQPEGLEAMRKTGRVPIIPAEGVIKYTEAEKEAIRRGLAPFPAVVERGRGGLPVPTTIARPGTVSRPGPVSGEPTIRKVPKKAIPIEEQTPNLPALKQDGSLVSLGDRQVVKYGYNDIKSGEGFDRVLSEVADGKKASTVIQKVGEMEEVVARQFSEKVPKKLKITVTLKKRMNTLGYSGEEVDAMSTKIAANIERFSGKKKETPAIDAMLREPLPKQPRSKIDLAGKDIATEEKLYNWAKGLPDAQRADMAERGTIPEAINKRIRQEKGKVIEKGDPYKKQIAKEIEEEKIMGSYGSGSTPKEDGSYHIMDKTEFVLKMMADKAKRSPEVAKAITIGATGATVMGALSMPDEAEAGVMSNLAKVFKIATKKEGDAVASKLNLMYNGVQEGVDGPVGHLFTSLESKSTFFSSSADEIAVAAALKRNNDIWKAAKITKDTAVGATILAGLNVALDSIFSPSEAEAAGLGDIGRVVSGFTANLLKEAKPTKVKDMLKGMDEVGLLGKSQVDHCYVNVEPRKSLIITPDIKDVVKKPSLPPGAEAVLSPHVSFSYYTGVKEGQELMNNAGVQWGNCQGTSIWNTIQGHKTLMNILEDFIPGYKGNAKGVIKDMTPLVEKYNASMQERSFNYAKYKDFNMLYKKELSKMNKKRKFGKGEQDDMLNTVVRLEKKAKEYKTLYDASEDMKNAYQAEWHATVKGIASKSENAGTRIFLAAEDTATFDNYPWLKNMISWEEKAAAGKIKDMMEQYSVRVLEAGGKVITNRPFMHHPWHPTMKNNKASMADDYTLASPPMTKIHSRSAGYMAMVPDAEYSTTSYLQDINLRLEAMDFWKKGEKGGWWAFKRWLVENPSQAPEGLVKTFTQFEKGFKPVDTSGGFNKFSEKLYAFEVARLLAFSASVPFKHALKLIADLRVFGMEGVKAMPKALISASKVAIKQRGGEEWLKKKGWGLDVMDEAVESYTETGKLYRIVSDISPFRVNESMADKVLNKFNEIGGSPTSAVERFDRSLSVIAAMRMASKKGMTPAQATYAIYDTILKANFLSGQLNPSWLRNPAIRLMMIFQGTPFKILEQRVLLHGRAWKGVGSTLKQLRKDVIKGEQDFKWEMIKQSLTKEKDLFGNSLLHQSIREMLLVGTAVTASKYVWDGDLSHHFFHPPFFKAKKRDIAIGASPVVNASLETYSKYMDEDYDEFITSTFFKSWFDSSYKGVPAPIPINFKKAARLTENDIPEIYRGSKLRYLFGIPASGEH